MYLISLVVNDVNKDVTEDQITGDMQHQNPLEESLPKGKLKTREAISVFFTSSFIPLSGYGKMLTLFIFSFVRIFCKCMS